MIYLSVLFYGIFIKIHFFELWQFSAGFKYCSASSDIMAANSVCIYAVSQKTRHQTLAHNFTKY